MDDTFASFKLLQLIIARESHVIDLIFALTNYILITVSIQQVVLPSTKMLSLP